MPRPTHPIAITVAVLLLADCGEANPPTAVSGGNASVGVSIPAQAEASRSTVTLNMLDACDPATFNAAVGPGTCSRQGGMTFSQFIAELTRHQTAGAWLFAPASFPANVGQTIVATNRGGETHTFTHVAAFGGGIVPPLNTLSGNPVEAPECRQLEADDFVPPGRTFRAPLDQADTQLFQCCIHPWMRATVQVH
jgi:plastocyanin